MLINENVFAELRSLYYSDGTTNKDISDRTGMAMQYITDITHGRKTANPVSVQLLRVAEAAGYDIELRFIKRS